jgi:hypothetical protein
MSNASKLAKDGTKRGGPRPGSGRKPKATRLVVSDVNRLTRDQVEEWLPKLLSNLKILADGGFERVEEKFSRNQAGDLVLIERKVSIAEPDRAANEYLINRLLGKPTERQEVSGPEGNAIPLVFEQAIMKIYGNQDQGELPAG